MCPNHTENFVDKKLLTSVCISERVKHWDRFSGLVSQDAMRLRFIKRSSRHHPLFRRKARLPSRKDLMIPKNVEQLYKRPNGVMPRVKDSLPFYGHSSLSFISSEFSSVEEKETWFSNVMLFQTSVIKQIFFKKTLHK
ncbi:PHD finger protein 12 [Caerostris extrusa]|uniref:PHD finger protein 12 n=1 Tax=Caerostris extrusa TaxID=172846 RepID=A0AAV4P9P8_CAEEX|nr:PHD finger protein 12 [Caerostris extrusa]